MLRIKPDPPNTPRAAPTTDKNKPCRRGIRPLLGTTYIPNLTRANFFPCHRLLIEAVCAVWAEAARASTSSQPRAHTSKRETTKRAASTSRTMTTPGGRGRPRRSRHAFITSTARVDCPLFALAVSPPCETSAVSTAFEFVLVSRTVCVPRPCDTAVWTGHSQPSSSSATIHPPKNNETTTPAIPTHSLPASGGWGAGRAAVQRSTGDRTSRKEDPNFPAFSDFGVGYR